MRSPKELLASPDTWSILRPIVPVLITIVGVRLGNIILPILRLKRRVELLNVLQTVAPELYQALGAPSPTLWQQLFRRRDCLANDRLWFYALWRMDIFPDDPRVRAALRRYRRIELIALCYTAGILLLAALVFIFMPR